jgi:hypothetical protein
VTLKSIKLTPRDIEGRILDIEDIALNRKNEAFRNWFLKKASKTMDFTFQKITDFKETED